MTRRSEEGDFYVYAWRRPDTDQIFYIGKGRGRRARCPKKGNPLFSRIVDKLTHSGLEPTIEYLFEGLSEEKAFAIERAEITRYGRRDNGTGILANLTDGGEGASGHIKSESARAKISAAASNPSEETRTKMRSWDRTPEMRAKISAANSNPTPEKLAKLSAWERTPAMRAKLSAASSGRKQSSETIERRAAAIRVNGPRFGEFKGVRPSGKKWSARIHLDSKEAYIGSYATPEDAAMAYDVAAYAAFGEGCYQNFKGRAPA